VNGIGSSSASESCDSPGSPHPRSILPLRSAGLGPESDQDAADGHGAKHELAVQFGRIRHLRGPDTGPQRTYAQAFRNGSFEAVNSLRLNDSRTPQGLRALKLEQEICDVTQTFLSILREAGMIAPGALLIALLGVRATSIYHGSADEDQRDTIDRDTVILPDILLEMTEGSSLTAALRPAFDALWQASGWERSMGYDQRGSWVDRLHK
jgi:hypothetical protein